MFETATLRSGYSVADSAEFAGRIERMLRVAMDVDLNAKVSFFKGRLTKSQLLQNHLQMQAI